MQFIILGCGSSMGVPRPDGFFGNCDPENKKNYANANSILIDDMQKNIDQWRAAGGIGILHTSAASTIEQLKKLGL